MVTGERVNLWACRNNCCYCLQLTHNQITDIAPLKLLTSLEILTASETKPYSNQIRCDDVDIVGVVVVVDVVVVVVVVVVVLQLDDNQIIDVAPLKRLTSLMMLWVGKQWC
jgi:uncharacterized membrane protein